MSNLISNKEALMALANGEEVECFDTRETFKSLGWFDVKGIGVNMFFSDILKFRLKPKTVSINGTEVPAPFKPKHGEMVWCLNELSDKGYEARTAYDLNDFIPLIAYWRTEDEIKQVVEVLRKVFNQEGVF